jgi:hypothetical protein
MPDRSSTTRNLDLPPTQVCCIVSPGVDQTVLAPLFGIAGMLSRDARLEAYGHYLVALRDRGTRGLILEVGADGRQVLLYAEPGIPRLIGRQSRLAGHLLRDTPEDDRIAELIEHGIHFLVSG